MKLLVFTLLDKPQVWSLRLNYNYLASSYFNSSSGPKFKSVCDLYLRSYHDEELIT